jgi:hypothetical protein
MRNIALLAAVLLTPAAAHARLFWQTYGATVAADGCAWNLNQDYFVPRHCDSGRYGLFSACKTARTISPACKNLHPIYCGYCTPYGSCHYKWRDHVYKTFCGCTPLKYKRGPWHLENCLKLPLIHGHSPTCGHAAWGFAPLPAMVELACAPVNPEAFYLCNVEPMGGEILGSIAALATGAAGSSAATVAAPPAAARPLPPKLNLTPTANPGGGLPAPFNY